MFEVKIKCHQKKKQNLLHYSFKVSIYSYFPPLIIIDNAYVNYFFFNRIKMLPLTFGAAEAPADADHQAEDEERRCGTQRQDHDHAGSCCGNHSNDHHDENNNTTTTHVACNFGGRLKSTIRNLRRGKNGREGRYWIASKQPQNSKRREKK